MRDERTDAEILRDLRLALNQDSVIPDGYFTAEQWAKRFNLSPRQTRDILNRSVENGVAEFLFARVNGFKVKIFKCGFAKKSAKVKQRN